MPIRQPHKYHWIAVGLLVAIYLFNGILAIPKLSVNGDEANHFNYAVRLLKGKPDKVRADEDASCLPVSVINTIPRAVEQIFNPSLARNDNGVSDITRGRYITLLIGLLLGFYIYRWSKQWYGENASLISLGLFVFCPNLGAYAATIMTDLYAALFTIIPLYHFWKFRESRSLKQFFFFSIALALGQISKQSLSHLYLIFFVLWILPILARTQQMGGWKDVLGRLFILIGIQILVINLGFQFRHFGEPLSDYHFQSHRFTAMTRLIGPVASIPLPLPEPYLQGLDQSMHLVELGPGTKIAAADNYLFEEKRRSGFPYYYLAILFFKIPIATLIAMIISILLMIRHFNISFWKNEFLLIFPVFYFLTYFSIGLNIQGGIRFVLMIFPLLFVLCGRLGIERFENTGVVFLKWLNRAGIVALAWLLLSFYYYWPNLPPYSNEFILDKKMAYRVMGDSNLDNGQANYFLDDFLSKHGEYKAAPLQPTAGKFYIGVNELLDLYDEGKYGWLLGNFSPAAHVAHSYLVFDVNKEQLLANLRIAK